MREHEIRSYCAMCYNNCPIVAHFKKGRLVKITADKEHLFFRPLCPKGIAASELVYNSQRLEYPMKRTRPKGDPDPGWERISWEEALTTIADKLAAIKEQYGPEALAVQQSYAGSSLWEIAAFVRRFNNIYGTPNNISTTYICNWHRDCGSSYTYARQHMSYAAGWPDFKRSGCILVWGNNPATTRNAYCWELRKGLKNGAKLIVVDPRKTPLAAAADIWLQVKPGTDGALLLGMLHVMIKEERYDSAFVKNWTNAPFLVRADTGNLLTAADLKSGGDKDGYVLLDSATNQPVLLVSPEKAPPFDAVLDAMVDVQLADGSHVICSTVFRLLWERVSAYDPDMVSKLTTVPTDKMRDAVHMLAAHGPSCWQSYNGIEENMNAMQTNRALCILYALTGDYDKPGGNCLQTLPPLGFPLGLEFMNNDIFTKIPGIKEYPLGPEGSSMDIPAFFLYRAILDGKPYPIKALLGYGGNLLLSNPDSMLGRNALKKLEFHAHMELFLTPTAQFADIVLPATSFLESEHVGIPLNYNAYVEGNYVLQRRPAVVAPVGESRSVLEVVFALAQKMGFGDNFWNGDIRAAYASQLESTGVTLAALSNSPGGVLKKMAVTHQKYKTQGFPTPTQKVEFFSQPLKDIGQDPLPTWNDPYTIFAEKGWDQGYPLILTNSKLKAFLHSQHRSLPSLRKMHPHPFLEMHPLKAKELGIKDQDWVELATVHGRITLQAKLTDTIAENVVCTQHGWWQACPELHLPGYDPFSENGANANRLYTEALRDPISSSIHIRGFPCRVQKVNSVDSTEVV